MALHKHVFYRRASPKVKAGWRAQVRRDGRRAHSPAFATQFDAALWAARELGCEMESLCLPVQRFRIRGESSPWSLWLGGALPAPLVENDEPQGVPPRDSELPAPQVKKEPRDVPPHDSELPAPQVSEPTAQSQLESQLAAVLQQAARAATSQLESQLAEVAAALEEERAKVSRLVTNNLELHDRLSMANFDR